MRQAQVYSTSKQHGVALASAMIILLVMTLISLASINATYLDEKITRNLRDLNLAMQSAESALRQAEQAIDSMSTTNDFGNVSGLYAQGNAPDPYYANTWTTNASIKSSGDFGGVNPPRYFIEYIGDYGDELTSGNINNYGAAQNYKVSLFRIVSRGTGMSDTAQVMLKVFYGRQF